MTDLSKTIEPKSDQINADDLIAGPKNIKITKVSACPGSAEQPIAIYFEGDNGKPYKPCKSMRRVLVNIWGADGGEYVGRSMTLYRDDKVVFGGLAVGGIRISHVSNIDRDVTLVLTASKASRKPFVVQPLVIEPPRQTKAPRTFEVVGSDGSVTEFHVSDDGFQAALKALWRDLPAVGINGALLSKIATNERLSQFHDEVKRLLSSGAQSPSTETGDGWPGPDTAAQS